MTLMKVISDVSGPNLTFLLKILLILVILKPDVLARRHGMDQWSSNHDTVMALTALVDYSLQNRVRIRKIFSAGLELRFSLQVSLDQKQG